MAITPGTTIVVGSGRLAHLRLDHPDIELAHVKVSWDDQGISMIDNGSRKGTWVNGELVETTALLDGDVITFVPPGAKTTPPRIRVKIPKGAVPEPPPPPPEPPTAGPAATPPPVVSRARGPVRTRRSRGRRSGFGLRSLGRGFSLAALALLGGGIAALAIVAWLVSRLFFADPVVTGILPGQAEPGQKVSLSGRRFDQEASRNTVWFGDRSAVASSVGGETLTVTVPSVPRGGPVPVSVETSRGRSKPVPFTLLPLLKATGLEPSGALSGDEVTLRGQGFDSGPVTVTVAATPAHVIAAEAGSVRFQVPGVQGPPGRPLAVVATVGGRSTAPLNLALGRPPIVVSFEPPRAVAGDIVRIHGVGFSSDPAGAGATFDGVPALVVAATPSEMTVVAPVPARPQAETFGPVVVRAGDRVSSEGATYPLLRLVEGSYVLRFLAAAVGEGASGQAFVATEMGPVLLLSWQDDSRSVAERAQRVAARLNALVDRARGGTAVAFEAREQADVGVGIAGEPDLVLRVTPQDAAAYGAPPGLPPRSAPPTPAALARYWAALLNDYVTIGTGSGRPSQLTALSPAAGSALGQLRSALPWQYEVGVGAGRVATLPVDLRRRLREAALRVP
jgi:hypothetical protein